MNTSISQTATYVDLRCPIGPKKLLGKVRQMGDRHALVDGNLLELACRDCRNIVAMQNGKKPSMVLHRFNIVGELVESEVIFD